MAWVKKHENLIALWKFNKRASLVGLQIGYGDFPLRIIEYLSRAKKPYNFVVTAHKNLTYLQKMKEPLVNEKESLYSNSIFPSYQFVVLYLEMISSGQLLLEQMAEKIANKQSKDQINFQIFSSSKDSMSIFKQQVDTGGSLKTCDSQDQLPDLKYIQV